MNRFSQSGWKRISLRMGEYKLHPLAGLKYLQRNTSLTSTTVGGDLSSTARPDKYAQYSCLSSTAARRETAFIPLDTASGINPLLRTPIFTHGCLNLMRAA